MRDECSHGVELSIPDVIAIRQDLLACHGADAPAVHGWWNELQTAQPTNDPALTPAAPQQDWYAKDPHKRDSTMTPDRASRNFWPSEPPGRGVAVSPRAERVSGSVCCLGG